MKNFLKAGTLLLAISLSAAALAGCAGSAAAAGPAPTAYNETAPAAAAFNPAGDVQPAQAAQPAVGDLLTDEQAAGLQYMREEEKLAHDLYLKLFEIWGLPVFQNIASSEAAHTAAVENLLAQFGLADPAAGLPAGSFSDPSLQALYDQLLSRGSSSLEEALRVGALVEEVDIQDLAGRMAGISDAAVARVYTNLMAGSENHLRAFVSQLTARTGEEYTSQVLSTAQVAEILTAGSGRWRAASSR